MSMGAWADPTSVSYGDDGGWIFFLIIFGLVLLVGLTSSTKEKVDRKVREIQIKNEPEKKEHFKGRYAKELWEKSLLHKFAKEEFDFLHLEKNHWQIECMCFLCKNFEEYSDFGEFRYDASHEWEAWEKVKESNKQNWVSNSLAKCPLCSVDVEGRFSTNYLQHQYNLPQEATQSLNILMEHAAYIREFISIGGPDCDKEQTKYELEKVLSKFNHPFSNSLSGINRSGLHFSLFHSKEEYLKDKELPIGFIEIIEPDDYLNPADRKPEENYYIFSYKDLLSISMTKELILPELKLVNKIAYDI